MYTDIEGQLGKISNSIKADSISGIESEITGDDLLPEEADFEEVKFDDDDEDNENAVSVEKLKRECLGSPESELKDLEDGKYNVDRSE